MTPEGVLAYWLPTIPLTVNDMINRRAAATGSVGYAMATAYSDYNGHHVGVGFRPHAVGGARWVAEYQWGERVVLSRGSLRSCLEAAKREYDRGARGTVVIVGLHEDAPESIEDQRAACEALGYVPFSQEIQREHDRTTRPHVEFDPLSRVPKIVRVGGAS